jgi:hypothetical protein
MGFAIDCLHAQKTPLHTLIPFLSEKNTTADQIYALCFDNQYVWQLRHNLGSACFDGRYCNDHNL